MKMQWYQKWVIWLAKKLKVFGTFDTEQALRKVHRLNRTLKQEKTDLLWAIADLEAQLAHVKRAYHDLAVIVANATGKSHPQIAAPVLSVEQKRQEDMKAFLGCETAELPKASGDMVRLYHSRTGPLRKINFSPHSESQRPREPKYETPDFLQDQDKKIS